MGTVAIFGAGVMGETLLSGLLRAGRDPEHLVITERRADRAAELTEKYGVRALSNAEAAALADTHILVVKPQDIRGLLAEIRDHVAEDNLVVCIAAGITTGTVETALADGRAVVRVMPNTPALVLAAASCVYPNAACTEKDVEVATAIFGAIGLCQVVPESLLNAVTALSGSGPAFCFLFMEALADGGVKAGLSRELALKLAAKTMEGSARLFLEKNLHPGQLKDMVTSPSGTTIAGVAALEERAFRAAAIAAVDAAYARAVELSKM